MKRRRTVAIVAMKESDLAAQFPGEPGQPISPEVSIQRIEEGIIMNVLPQTLSTLLLLVGLAGEQGSAMAAEAATSPGAICKATGSGANVNVWTGNFYVLNTSTSNTQITCPVVRTFSPAANTTMVVYVDGYSPAGTTTSCSLSSYSYQGVYLGGVTSAGGGMYDITLTLPASSVPAWSAQSITCTVPSSGYIIDVETAH